MPRLVHWAAQRLPRRAWCVLLVLCWNQRLRCERMATALPSPGPWCVHLTTEATSHYKTAHFSSTAQHTSEDVPLHWPGVSWSLVPVQGGFRL